MRQLLLILFLVPAIAMAQTPLHRLLGKKTAPPSGCVDADAAAWIAASGIADSTGIHEFFCGLKDSSLYTTMANSGNGAAWLLFGGSDATTKLNIFDPVDADASFRLTYFNSPTFSSSGVDWNGTNQYANTHIPVNLNGYSNVSMFYYSRENTSTSTSIDMGYVTSPGDRYFLTADINNTSSAWWASPNIISTTPASRAGFFIGTTNGTAMSLSRNGADITTGTRSGGPSITSPVTLGGAASLGNYTNRQCAFAGVTPALSSDQRRALNFLVEQLMDARGIGVQ